MRDRSLALNSYRQQVSRADGWETETRTQESWNQNPPYDANASVINSVTSRPTVLIDHLLALVLGKGRFLGRALFRQEERFGVLPICCPA